MILRISVLHLSSFNYNGGVMVSMLASCTVNRGGKPKTCKMCTCCFYGKRAALKSKSKAWGGVTCLPTDYCFSQLAL
jgi:hypothetical protein